MRRYTRDQATELLAEYEATHPVEEYRFFDWHAWPLLRITIGSYMVGLGSPPGTVRRPLWRRVAGRCVRLPRSGWRRFRASEQASFSPAAPADVALLTHSNRSEMIGGALWHPIADPIASTLRRAGLAVQVWDRGPVQQPRQNQPVWIQEALQNAATTPRPDIGAALSLTGRAWLAEWNRWTTKVLDHELPPELFPRRAGVIDRQCRLFERWLGESGCRCLLVDTWYGPPVLAAVMAARRLRIPVVDVQHGVQGDGHFAYTRWTKKLQGGFEQVPDVAWLWGKNPVHWGHQRPMPAAAIGNLWLNRWRHAAEPAFAETLAEASRLAENHQRTVLVTTQPVVDLRPVYDAIRWSPGDWRWLVRTHRGTNGVQQRGILEGLRRLGHPGVEVDRATSLPLYALIQAADVHVTGYSTCALEALGLHTPTVVFHPAGHTAFGHFIEQGSMCAARNGEEIVAAIPQMAD
ncbi:MAG: hypothetical protein ACOC46_04575, partial [Pirellulales bacterium]